MKDKINKRWAVVGLIWAGVIFLTWWNVDTMDRIRSPRERIEISYTEMQFVQYNSENISSVLKKTALFCQPVESLKLGCLSVENQLRSLATEYDLKEFKTKLESLKLGCLSVENQLRSLATEYDLKEFKTECQPGEDNQGSMPIKLSFQGPFKRALKLLGVLQKDYPYLLIKQVEMIPYELEDNIKFRIFCNYRYRITTTGTST